MELQPETPEIASIGTVININVACREVKLVESPIVVAVDFNKVCV